MVRLVVLGNSSSIRAARGAHAGLLDVFHSLLSAHQLRIPHERLQLLVGFLLLLVGSTCRLRDIHAIGKLAAIACLTAVPF